MAARRPRVDCPQCGRDVALNPKGAIRLHVDQGGESGHYYCPASGQLPAAQIREVELARLAELVERYPEQAWILVAYLTCERCGGKGRTANVGALPPGYPTHSTCSLCSGRGALPRGSDPLRQAERVEVTEEGA